MKLKMKSYIQPFEKVLAVMELSELADTADIDMMETETEYNIETNIKKDILRDNLAYWESVGDHPERKTWQVLIENTYKGKNIYNQRNCSEESGTDFGKTRILRYGMHDLHEYRGKFFPQLVRACINIAGIERESIVLDPFCGSGTTLCEAKVRGMKAVGTDLNPLSVMISRVKAGIFDLEKEDIADEYSMVKNRMDERNTDYSKRWKEADLKYLEGWFAKEALEDINNLLDAIDLVENTMIADLFRVNLSNIIRGISWQKESDLRVRKEITDYRKGTVYSRFCEEVERQFEKIFPYLDSVNELDKPKSRIIEGNTVNLVHDAKEFVGKCDVIITSPPYATALPYLDTDRLSIIILGLMNRKAFPDKNRQMVGNREISEKQRKELWEVYLSRKSELTLEICELIEKIADENHKPGVGFRRRNLPALLAKYFLDMLDSVKAADQMLKPGAKVFYVVGNNSTDVAGEKVIIETNVLLWNLFEKAGWIKEDYIDMDMLKARAGYRNNPGTTEAILIFRKRG